MGPDYGKSVTIFNIGTFGGSGFASLLESYGYTVSKNTEKPITPEKLEGYDVLIIMNAYRNYTDEEVNTIKKFVNNGGGLFLVEITGVILMVGRIFPSIKLPRALEFHSPTTSWW